MIFIGSKGERILYQYCKVGGTGIIGCVAAFFIIILKKKMISLLHGYQPFSDGFSVQ